MNTRAIGFINLVDWGVRGRVKIGTRFYNPQADTICRLLYYDVRRDYVTIETCPWRTLWMRLGHRP